MNHLRQIEQVGGYRACLAPGGRRASTVPGGSLFTSRPGSVFTSVEESWHKTLKKTTIRPKRPESVDEARRMVEDFVAQYNTVRLHSGIGYITPEDKLAGREKAIWEQRDRKLEAARSRRRQRRLENAAI